MSCQLMVSNHPGRPGPPGKDLRLNAWMRYCVIPSIESDFVPGEGLQAAVIEE
jgi:hypothetical protein